ncbi:MAG TPA: DUF6680 family protein [Terriglobales bacterium]|nr:DUF6680 family protein [Terriglobales bacterium]
MPHPSWFDWLTVAAIFFGPIFALTAQRGLDRFREKKQRRYLLYATLMSLRNDPVNPDHVRALNSVDAVFDGDGKDTAVRQAWDRVLAHVITDRSANPAQWDSTLIDLRVDLYQAVGKAVGYDHTVEYIKNHLYTPQHFGEVWVEQTQIRKGLAQALTPDGLKVVITQPTAGVPTAAAPSRRI